MITESDMRNILRDRCAEAGGQKVYANQIGMSETYISDVLLGRKGISANLAKLMGYDRRPLFFSCNPQSSGA